MERPLVGLFSGPNSLAVSLVENLLANFCRVEIVSNDKKNWIKRLEHIQMQGLVNISSEKLARKDDFDYAIFIDLPPQKAIDYSQQKQVKILTILPYRDLKKIDRSYHLPETVGVVFVGDLFGPRMDLTEITDLSQLQFPVFLPDVAKQITQWLFSFGPFGRETKLLSIGDRVSLAGHLKETIQWFNSHPQSAELKPERAKLKIKFWGWVFLLSLFLLLSPYLFLGFSGVVLSNLRAKALERNLAISKDLLSVSKISASLSLKTMQAANQIPLLKKVYQPGLFFSRVFRDASDIGFKITDLAEKTLDLTGRMTGSAPYDIISFAKEYQIEIDSLSEDILFLEGEIKAANDFWQNRFIPNQFSANFKDLKKYLFQAKILTTQMAEILGGYKKKKYLILLQNNMELRPTGGFIGSFALVTLDGGRISEITVQDIYSADGQLKGHIEPPPAIKNYLKEANWYLRDSNWDPDFPTSAQRAEWFLDKEIDVSVDGVVAVDLEFIRNLLEVIGPINLPDFGVELGVDNFYERTQIEVEKDFFPGSYRKSSFLTALTKAILERLTTPTKNNSLLIFKAIFISLEQRHIQIFLHNPKAQMVIRSLNWDGSVNQNACGNNCLTDWFGLVEANLGVNKANYFIERDFSLDVNLKENGEVEKTLLVTFRNSANQTFGPQAIYKVFLRILIPPDSLFKEMSLISGSTQEELPHQTELVSGREEVGSYFEILPGQSRTLFLKWTSGTKLDFSKTGEFRLLWRKQAGLGSSPANINFNFPAGIEFRLEPDRALTKNPDGGYNASFSRDIVSRILWINKF